MMFSIKSNILQTKNTDILTIILFDVLLVSLNNGSNLKKLAGFINDLALLLHKVQSINSLTLIFQKYEQGIRANCGIMAIFGS